MPSALGSQDANALKRPRQSAAMFGAVCYAAGTASREDASSQCPYAERPTTQDRTHDPSPLRRGRRLGTVGAGVLKLLRDNADIIAARAGRPIAVTAVPRATAPTTAACRCRPALVPGPGRARRRPGVDIVVEFIGGSDGPARALVQAALAAGKPVVTANKAMLAVHGASLAAAAEERGVPLAFEAAVAVASR